MWKLSRKPASHHPGVMSISFRGMSAAGMGRGSCLPPHHGERLTANLGRLVI
jgi:hypothetical protein